jgi:hypothetical protein
VALFDYVAASPAGSRWGFGGTCVNVGCIPKKLMHYAALCGEACEDARHFGWNIEAQGHDWGKMKTAVQDHIQKLNFFYENGVKPQEGQERSLWTTTHYYHIWTRHINPRFYSQVSMVLQRTGLPHSRDDVADSGVPQPLPRLTLVRSLSAGSV